MGYSKRVSIPRSDYPATLSLEALTRIKAKNLPLGLQPKRDELAAAQAAARDAESVVARIRQELDDEKVGTPAPAERPFPLARLAAQSRDSNRS